MSDPARFADELFPHADELFRLARHLTPSPSDAEDLVQETFSRAIAASRQFDRGTNLRAWLFRILRNAHIDAARRRRVNPVMLFDDPEEIDRAAVDREPLRGDEELERLRHVVGEHIESALATLSSDARLLVLLDLDGFSEGELAEVLGCARGTIKSRLSRARAALRVRLSEYAR